MENLCLKLKLDCDTMSEKQLFQIYKMRNETPSPLLQKRLVGRTLVICTVRHHHYIIIIIFHTQHCTTYTQPKHKKYPKYSSTVIV